MKTKPRFCSFILPATFPPNLARNAGLLCALILFAAPAWGAAVLRTNVYHQLTAFSADGVLGNNHGPVVSADGGKIAFARSWYGSPRSNLIYTVNFDGTGLKLVDTWQADPGAEVDISADGASVMSSQGDVVRVVNADGSGAHDVIRIYGAYKQYRLSPDGTKVYFLANGGFETSPPTGSRDAGVYMVDAAGGNPQPIVTPTSLAAYLGVSAGAVSMGGYGGNVWLAVSGDGTNLLFSAYSGGYRLFRVRSDGTGLMEYALGTEPDIGSFQVENFGFSGDGSKIFYFLFRNAGGFKQELGILNADGSGQRGLLTNTACCWGIHGEFVQLTQDGSKLLFGSTSWLINTDGSGRQQVFGPNSYTEIMRWGFYHGVMNSNATRFVYLSPVENGPLQLATLEVNPPSLGLAPPISEASASPPYVRNSDQSWTFLTARAPTNGLLSNFVGAFGFLNGLPDSALEQWYMVDDGSAGDIQGGDGLYSRWLSGQNWSALGPRTMRFKTEWRATDAKYHSTVVEIAPFFVVSQVPTNPPPAITSVIPDNSPPGTSVTINGSGFDTNAPNNMVLFGNSLAWIISVNAAGTQLVVVVPPDLPPGPAEVSVSALGQISAAVTYTTPDPDASTLRLKMLAGLEVFGTVGKTYRIDYLSDLTDTNSWLPLTNLTLSTSPYFWVDVSSTNQSKRFYRSIHLP